MVNCVTAPPVIAAARPEGAALAGGVHEGSSTT